MRRLNPWRGLAGLPREVWVLFVTNLVNRAGTMALPFLALYLTRRLGWPASRAGLALAAYGVGALVTAPFAGRLADRVGAIRVLRLSLFVSGVLIGAFPFARSFEVVLGLAFFWAIASEAFRPASLALMVDLVPPERRKSAYAANRLAINLGMSIGPAVGGFLVLVSFPALFAIDAVTTVAAGLILTLVPWRAPGAPTRAHPPAAPANSAAAPGAFADRRLIYFLLALFPVIMVFFQMTAGLPLFLVRDLGFRESTYGMLFTLNTLIIILLEVPLNTAMTRWRHSRGLSLGALLYGVGFGVLAFTRDLPGVIGSTVIWTFGEMVLLPGSSAYMAEIAPEGKRGQYMGLYTMTFSAAYCVGPWLGTLVLDRVSGRALWLGTLALGLLSASLLFRLDAKRHGGAPLAVSASSSGKDPRSPR